MRLQKLSCTKQILRLSQAQQNVEHALNETKHAKYFVLPLPSSIRITKYLLESVTASTTQPGYCSTGACANSSPAKSKFTPNKAPGLFSVTNKLSS